MLQRSDGSPAHLAKAVVSVSEEATVLGEGPQTGRVGAVEQRQSNSCWSCSCSVVSKAVRCPIWAHSLALALRAASQNPRDPSFASAARQISGAPGQGSPEHASVLCEGPQTGGVGVVEQLLQLLSCAWETVLLVSRACHLTAAETLQVAPPIAVRLGRHLDSTSAMTKSTEGCAQTRSAEHKLKRSMALSAVRFLCWERAPDTLKGADWFLFGGENTP